MCTPIGHCLAGAALTLAAPVQKSFGFWQIALFIVIFSNLPDMDFLFGILEDEPGKYHQQWTHSIGFVFIISVLVFIAGTLFFKSQGLKLALLAIILMTSHLVLDLYSLDTSYPYGFQLLWPVKKSYFIRYMPIFRNTLRGGSADTFISGIFTQHNLITVLWELIIFMPLLIMSVLIKKCFKRMEILK